jgi:hypothetical protein
MEDQGFVSRRICESTRKCWTLRGKEALAGGDRSAKRLGVSRKITRTAFFYVQDERYFAIEHKDVRREAPRGPHMCPAGPEVRYRATSAPILIKSIAASVASYVQDKVRPGNGREGALGYERYIAIEHMDVRSDRGDDFAVD